MESSPARLPLAELSSSSSSRSWEPGRAAPESCGLEPGRIGKVWARTKSHRPAGEWPAKVWVRTKSHRRAGEELSPTSFSPSILPNTVIDVDTPQESMVKGKSGMHPHQGVTEHEL